MHPQGETRAIHVRPPRRAPGALLARKAATRPKPTRPCTWPVVYRAVRSARRKIIWVILWIDFMCWKYLAKFYFDYCTRSTECNMKTFRVRIRQYRTVRESCTGAIRTRRRRSTWRQCRTSSGSRKAGAFSQRRRRGLCKASRVRATCAQLRSGTALWRACDLCSHLRRPVNTHVVQTTWAPTGHDDCSATAVYLPRVLPSLLLAGSKWTKHARRRTSKLCVCRASDAQVAKTIALPLDDVPTVRGARKSKRGLRTRLMKEDDARRRTI